VIPSCSPARFPVEGREPLLDEAVTVGDDRVRLGRGGVGDKAIAGDDDGSGTRAGRDVAAWTIPAASGVEAKDFPQRLAAHRRMDRRSEGLATPSSSMSRSLRSGKVSSSTSAASKRGACRARPRPDSLGRAIVHGRIYSRKLITRAHRLRHRDLLSLEREIPYHQKQSTLSDFVGIFAVLTIEI
jgi:hypothetical protein